jgi:hypothetical protein
MVRRLFTVAVAAGGGVIAGVIFEQELRRKGKSVAKSILRGTEDGLEKLREDFEDLRAEVASERAQRQSSAAAPM